MTAYIVLTKSVTSIEPGKEGPLRDHWREVGPPTDAVSPEAAIRKAIDGDKGGTFVAIPVRSFKVQTVTVETKRTVKLS